jgi:quercetin dioxygenase-like cupin family protein
MFPFLTALTMFVVTMGHGQDPLKVGGGIYKKLLENDRVRVLEVTFKPGESIAVHSHPDHAVYAVTAGKIEITANGKTQTADLKAGDTMWIPAESHSAKNTGGTTVKLVVVELREKAK